MVVRTSTPLVLLHWSPELYLPVVVAASVAGVADAAAVAATDALAAAVDVEAGAAAATVV